MTPTPSIFESFNARSLNPDQVAATFVPSRPFEQLCKRCHTIVLGPRGSGKTTLLKMLQPSALEAWDHPKAEEMVSRIDFTGIFIATDNAWNEQLLALGSGRLNESIREMLSVASFTTHVLKSVIATLLQRLQGSKGRTVREFRRMAADPQAEACLAKDISSAWHLGPVIPTFRAIKQALAKRALDIRDIAGREATMTLGGGSVAECAERLSSKPFLHLHFVQAASYAIEIIEDRFGIEGEKWAFLFDELELAPSWIHDELLRSIRSTDQRFLFKLAINPYTLNSRLLQATTSAAPGQDFEQVPLWYSEKRESHLFCESLWTQLVKDKGLPFVGPKKALGPSYFQAEENHDRDLGQAYAPGSRWATRFKSLALKDPSFAEYLRVKRIDLSRMHLLKENDRAADIRKIAPIVAMREFYRQPEAVGSNREVRSRKTAELYTGADSIFAVTEGNPRWFIGLMTRLIDLSQRQEDVRRRFTPIPRELQANEIWNVSQRFSATLRSIPVGPSIARMHLGVNSLTRQIGRYFFREAIRGEFRPEPPGSFIVDSNTKDEIAMALGKALNAGGIVYVPDDEGQWILSAVNGKRFRLSYLLAPLYGFPIRLGKEVALKTILAGEASPGQTNPQPDQLGLLDEEL